MEREKIPVRERKNEWRKRKREGCDALKTIPFSFHFLGRENSRTCLIGCHTNDYTYLMTGIELLNKLIGFRTELISEQKICVAIGKEDGVTLAVKNSRITSKKFSPKDHFSRPPFEQNFGGRRRREGRERENFPPWFLFSFPTFEWSSSFGLNLFVYTWCKGEKVSLRETKSEREKVEREKFDESDSPVRIGNEFLVMKWDEEETETDRERGRKVSSPGISIDFSLSIKWCLEIHKHKKEGERGRRRNREEENSEMRWDQKKSPEARCRKER